MTNSHLINFFNPVFLFGKLSAIFLLNIFSTTKVQNCIMEINCDVLAIVILFITCCITHCPAVILFNFLPTSFLTFNL